MGSPVYSQLLRSFLVSSGMLLAVGQGVSLGAEPELIAHWRLLGDSRDQSGHGHDATPKGGINLQATGLQGKPASAGEFNGRNSWLEVSGKNVPRLGTSDFSIAAWVFANDATNDVPGDLISCYDSDRHRGFHVSIKTNSGVTSNQSNLQHLHFGIDDDRSTEWVDCGRPGNALLAFAMASHQDALYVGTCEPAAGQTGRVYRYGGKDQWIDCGAPDGSNAVTAMAVHNGQLYAGTGNYRVAGSALPESTNQVPGGRIFRYGGDNRWEDCGQVPDSVAIAGLVTFNEELYASSLYKPAGFYRFDGKKSWIDSGTPDGKRVEALGVWNGHLYAGSYDGGHVYRFDGKTWTDCGLVGENTQTYSFAIYEGKLHVGTWPSGRVYRFEGVNKWTDIGQLGTEREVMGMLVHNGRFIGGTLPLGEVYEYRGDTRWQRLAQLDLTPDVQYRRVWAMGEHGGRMFSSTLPSGRVYAFQAGQNVFWEHPFPVGNWHHVTATRTADRLALYLDGKLVAESQQLDMKDWNLDSDAPLRIGSGINDHFLGKLSDVRMYRGALSAAQILELATPAKAAD